MIQDYIRKQSCRLFTGKYDIALEDRAPTCDDLSRRFQQIDELGIYLHIPFCDRICPYCPYNKELYHPDIARKYAIAVKKEIDVYSDIIGNRAVTSFYIGGGTPTTMLNSGIETILVHIYDTFNMQCEIHMESHPNHLSADNLNGLVSMGVKYLSIGVESLQDRHLKTLKRPYTAQEVTQAVRRAVGKHFNCVNADVIFALPDQTYHEIEQAGHMLVDMGVDQIAAYPLFKFPYTKMGSHGREVIFNLSTIVKRRKMLNLLEHIFYDAGFDRTSVWAFTKKDIPKYCSVTVPLYVGFGASGSSYLKDIFYLNTFNVGEYIKAFENGRMAIALSLDLSEKMQMAGWLYWRIYETRFTKKDFKKRFGQDFDSIYGKYMKPLALLGFLKDDGEQIVLTDRGAYWLHAFEDVFSIDYISTLWGTSKQEPWPERVIL
ncbi:radical SAM protein [bacterium]|nr:radical SAM protein [candidate division CSSED10-310 bacterium]